LSTQLVEYKEEYRDWEW